MSSEVTILHKKLIEPWSSMTVSKILSSSSVLDEIRSSLNNFEKKAQMRILLALLDVDPKKRNELVIPIRKLLETANKSDDEWIVITAGIVNNHLFGKTTINNGIDDNTLTKISELAHIAINRIKELITLSSLSSSSFYFQPYEYRYLSSSLTNGVTNQKSENLNFVYIGHKPDFILREKLNLEKKSSDGINKQKTNLGARIITNDNITSNNNTNNLLKNATNKFSSKFSSSSNANNVKSNLNKSKTFNIDAINSMPNPNKKRANPSSSSSSSSSSTEKKQKTDE